MPTYALLGATGAAGGAVLRYLLEAPPKGLKVSILVRSKSRLLSTFPKLEETPAFEVRILEGTPTDSRALQECLNGADVIINCVGSNESRPDKSISYDAAAAIIDGLKELKQRGRDEFRMPTVLQLRAAPVNPIFAAQAPKLVQAVLWFVFRWAYLDNLRASKLYADAAKETPGLLGYIFLDPGALHDSEGTQRTGYALVVEEKLEPNVSYADLGAGICEIALRREEFKSKGVGIGATGKYKATWGRNMVFMMSGVKNRMLHFVGML